MTLRRRSLSAPLAVGIVLAAGEGRRMGMPYHKLLLPFRGKTILQNLLESCLTSQLRKIFVVLGAEEGALRRSLAPYLAGSDSTRLELVSNHQFREGRSASLRAGLEAAGPDWQWYAVIHGDLPLVDAFLIDRLLVATGHLGLEPPLVVPVYGKRPGYPQVWHRRGFDELRNLFGEDCGRSLRMKYWKEAVQVRQAGDAFLVNVNTRSDYWNLMARTLEKNSQGFPSTIDHHSSTIFP